MSGDLLSRIAALNAEYAAVIDDDRLEEWPAFFLDDCLVYGPQNTGQALHGSLPKRS